MALPTNDHGALVAWLQASGVDTFEVAGCLLTADLERLLAVAGAAHRLTFAQDATLAAARSALSGHRAARDRPGFGLHPEHVPVAGRVHAVLVGVCAALGSVGVTAEPFEGIGVLVGDEVLGGKVLITDPSGLYSRMGATAAVGDDR